MNSTSTLCGWVLLLVGATLLSVRGEAELENLTNPERIALDQAVENFKAIAHKKKAAKTKIVSDYLTILDEVADSMASDGNLEALVQIRNEDRAVRAGESKATFIVGSDKLPSRLSEARKNYEAALTKLEEQAAAAEKQERAESILHLRRLQVAWTRQRRIDAALFAQELADSLENGDDSTMLGARPPLAASDTETESDPSDLSDRDGKAGDRSEVALNLQVALGFRYCPAGKFIMGSPEDETGRAQSLERHPQLRENQREVVIPQGFWIAETEVTQEQWKALMSKNPGKPEGDLKAVNFISWGEATEFCKKLDRELRSSTEFRRDWQATLPTSAQWEYACRAGTSSALSNGMDLTDNRACQHLKELSWYEFNKPRSRDHGNGQGPYPIAQLTPNPWGLMDMHGNVSEWCLDEVADPQGNPQQVLRICRSGHFKGWAFGCRSAAQHARLQEERFEQVGLRPVLVKTR